MQSYNFSRNWQELNLTELSEEELSNLFYEVFLSTGYVVEQVSERKWQLLQDGEVVKEGTYKDEASMRRSWVPNYLSDLSSAWRLLPYPNDNVTFSWNVLPNQYVNFRGWQVAVNWNQVHILKYVSGSTIEEAVLKTYIYLRSEWADKV